MKVFKGKRNVDDAYWLIVVDGKKNKLIAR